MDVALKEIKSKQMTIRKASELYKIPKTTLIDRLFGSLRNCHLNWATILSFARVC